MAAPSLQRSTGLHRFAVVTAVSTFILLIAGGLVTSNDAGLSVPDWPLSYGTWFPPMVGGIRFEHSHRMIAGVVGLLILALAVWLRSTEPRRWVRRLGYSAAGGVVLQALLGGLTVLLLLPPLVSVAHACLGQTVFALVVCLALATSSSWEESPLQINDRGRPSLRALGLLVAGMSAIQLVMGAILRHTGRGVAAHVSGALILLLLVVLVKVRAKRTDGLPRDLRDGVQRFERLLGAQLLLGVLALRWRHEAILVTAHVGVGALLLAQAVVLAWQIRRFIASARATAPAPVVSNQAAA